MKLKLDGIKYNVLCNESKTHANKIPILFLHGFTGCAYDWNFILDKLPHKYFPFAIDLIGHGETDSPENEAEYTCTAIVRHLNLILNHFGFEKTIIAGYSMGGRAAISFSLKNPHKIIAGIFESATAGIEDIQAKKERVEHDFILADKIRDEGVEPFLEFWFSSPMFRSLQNLSAFEELKTRRSQNTITGLANSLSAFSTGLMNSYWQELYKLKFPILLISGEQDEKYTSLNKKMFLKLKDSSHKIIPQAGHNTHLEKPELFTNLVLEFLNKIEGSNELKMV
ncbi:MAG: alpha/beta hydrolase fold protein [Ignavibacteria bacterium]|nr:MAG: alpha/beta hydrolase fold protein [Ignavibacteria bacterium]KAF0160821.1 MAG: alpha/beta hydrolase fold protein [Ignavibacteria bacterium]